MNDKIKEKANLKLNGDLYDFDVHEGTIGPDVLDISKLYAQSGKFTYDPGFILQTLNQLLLILMVKKELFFIEDIP